MIEYGYKIFIFCDRHDRRIAVTNFVHIGSDPDDSHYGRWNEHYTRKNGKESGITLMPDGTPYNLSEHLDFDPKVTRSNYTLTCRKCSEASGARGTSRWTRKGVNRGVSLTEANLFAMLNAVADHGVSEISLKGVGAIVEAQSRKR